MVTPEAPVNAVNRAQAAKLTIAKPLGSQPKRLSTTASSRCDVLASAST